VVFLGLLIVVSLLPSACVGGVESSAPLSFFKEFEVVEQTFSLSVGDVSINLTNGEGQTRREVRRTT